MPIGTYSNPSVALKNAKLVMKKTKCDAVKLENIKKNYRIIKFLVKKRIPVMGHIGFTPQHKSKFKIEGQSKREISKLLNLAKLIESAGAFSIVLECLAPECTQINYNNINSQLELVSSHCDGHQ